MVLLGQTLGPGDEREREETYAREVYYHDQGVIGLDLYFTDAGGQRWRRGSDGSLEEVPEDGSYPYWGLLIFGRSFHWAVIPLVIPPGSTSAPQERTGWTTDPT